MNYIKQLNAFEDWNERNQGSLSASGQLLWYKLIAIANRSGWVEWFQRSNPSLCGMTRMSERTVQTARNELKQVGLIDFIPGKTKNHPTRYKLVKLYEEDVTVVKFAPQTSPNASPHSSPNASPQTSALYKDKDKPKQNIEDEEAREAQKALALVMYNCDTLRSGFEMQEVNRWLDEFPTEVVMEAIRKIGLSGGEVKRPMTVIDRQLWEWRGKGLTTLDAIRSTYVSDRPAMQKKETQRERVERLMQERERRQASG